MGDTLAQELYRAFVNASGLSYGSDDTPGWHNLRTEQRDAWEQAAIKARTRVQLEVLATIDEIGTEYQTGDLDRALVLTRERLGLL